THERRTLHSCAHPESFPGCIPPCPDCDHAKHKRTEQLIIRLGQPMQSAETLCIVQQKVPGPAVQALLIRITTQKSKDQFANRRVHCIPCRTHCSQRGGHFPVAAPPQRRQQYQRIKLCHHCQP